MVIASGSRVELNGEEEGAFVRIGMNAGSNGAMTITGAGSELALLGRGAFLNVGREGQGEMTVSGGARVAINGDGGDYPGFSLGGLATGNGTMLVTGNGSEVIIANGGGGNGGGPGYIAIGSRSEEHTSELQSLMRISYAVFC